MRQIPFIALAFASLTSLQAQTHNHVGLVFNILVPMGEFREKTYLPSLDLPVSQVEGYDVGLGGQLTMSFPLQKNVAFRVGIGGTSTNGTNTASGYDTINLRHTMFSLSGEWQFFLRDAYEHRGTFLAVGISGDFERFSRTFEDWWGYELDVTRKNRLGGIISIGHSFYSRPVFNFTFELSYHATLTNKDLSRREPPASDLLKINFGFVF
ncbi:MAG: hypothetical protein LBH03_05265 [Holophagales bacterium]|jgi:hypothetical protein|nr:hypothetical protein [Holophagales bacterium]